MQTTNIYVGNLSYDATDSDLEHAFGVYGAVRSARVMVDRETRTARGFGFVEMDSQPEAESAIQGLNGTDLKGRPLTVNEAKSRPGGGRPSR